MSALATNKAVAVANKAIEATNMVAKNAVSSLSEAPFSATTVLLILVVLFGIIGFVWWFMNSRVYQTVKTDLGNAPTTTNNQKFVDEMTRKQIPIADTLFAEHRPIIGSEGGGGSKLSAGATPGEVGLASTDMMPADRLFVNFHVLGTRLGGFLGNQSRAGIYSEDRAVELALRKGCRLFLLEIDYLNRAPDVPVLVYRDEAGNNLSRNVGSLGRVMRALKKHTKDQKLIADDPLIFVLYVRRYPGETASAKESLNFMGAIAAEMQPIVPYLYKKPASGTFTEADLVKQPLEDFAGRMVVFSNADTSGFMGEVGATIPDARRLDHYVHARLYSGISKSPIDNLEATGPGKIAGSQVYSYNYFLTLPKDQQKADDARNTWTLAMSPTLDTPPTEAELNTIMDTLGVQGIVVDIFSDEEDLGAVYKSNRFKTFSYVPKPLATRLKAPASGVVAPASIKSNANGGAL